jgi:hypothetical protein
VGENCERVKKKSTTALLFFKSCYMSHEQGKDMENIFTAYITATVARLLSYLCLPMDIPVTSGLSRRDFVMQCHIPEDLTVQQYIVRI